MYVQLNISAKEKVVLLLIANEFSTIEIARKLNISPKTVENHRRSIAKKLGLSGNNCVLKFALSHQDVLLRE